MRMVVVYFPQPDVQMSLFDTSAPSSRSGSIRRIPLGRLSGLVMALWVLVGCGESGPPSSIGELEVVREQVGDTLVIRTMAGSTWGTEADLVPEVEVGVVEGDERYMFGSLRSIALGPDGRMYAVDGQIPALRVYEADGTHRADWGRSGGGPGEFGQVDGGLAVLSDGRVVVRDPGNARMQVFSAEGAALEVWSVVPGGFQTGSPMIRTRGDTLWTPLVLNLGVDISEWQWGFVRVAPTGQIVDSVAIPLDPDWEEPQVRVDSENGTSINNVPFAAEEHYALTPEGVFVHGISSRYAFSILDPARPVRVERVAEPVPVASAEKDQARDRIVRNFRRTDPAWRWNGPEIPDDKPAFDNLTVGEDGRFWVQRPGPSERRENPDFDPADPDSEVPRWEWVEPVLWDVFDPDGVFLGTVHAPEGFSVYPAPVFRGDLVLATTRDDLDVQRLVRYRIRPRTP